MHVLSSMMGFALPALLPRAYTHFASAVSVTIRLSMLINLHITVFFVVAIFILWGASSEGRLRDDWRGTQ